MLTCLNFVGLLHLLPEVIENMDTAFEELDIGDQDYPFACFVVCLGFLMVLIIEHIVLSFVRNEAVTDSELTDPSCHCKNNIRSGLPGIVHIFKPDMRGRTHAPGFLKLLWFAHWYVYVCLSVCVSAPRALITSGMI